MRPHAAVFLVFFLLCPVHPLGTNTELNDIIDEILAMMPLETKGIEAADDWFTYATDPDLYIPPSLYCAEYFKTREMKDFNNMVEYNPFKVWESKTNHYDRELNVFLSAVLADSILQGWVQPTGNHLNYHFAMDDGQVSLMSYDEPFPAHMEMYPALMALYLPDDMDICSFADNDTIEVNILVASPPWVCSLAKVQVNKEMFLDVEEEVCVCRPLNGSACQCYEPDVVTSTDGFSENGQFGKAMIPRFDASGEAWYTKIQEYPRMMVDLYATYDVIITQIHQVLKAVSIAPFCCYEDTWYRFGEQIPIPEDPCLICICDADWTGPEDCTVMECPLDRYFNETGDVVVEVIKITGMCCDQTTEVLFESICNNITSCEPNGECVPMGNNFTCECHPGYETTEDQHSCVDIDECAGATRKRDLPEICEHGTCENLNGTYRCECDEHYDNTLGDERFCVLSNMCMKHPELCTPNGRCNSTGDNYTCICDDGYQPTENLQDCEDADECLDGRCTPNGQCVNLPGAFYCVCDEFFYPTPDNECVGIDLCLDAIARCGEEPECINGGGGIYICQCPAGRTFDPLRGECVNDDSVIAIPIERGFDEKNDSGEFVVSENTIIKFYTNNSDCQYYLQLNLDFDLSVWHDNMTSEDCLDRKEVDKSPYIAVRDPFDDNIEHWYCGWRSNYTLLSYFNELYVRTNNAGQNQITFTINVKPFQGSGACCGGVLHAVPETENPFNQIGVTSANYPHPYNNDEWCSWVINGPNGTTEGKIAVFTIDFSVVVMVRSSEEDTLDCHVEDALFVSNTGMMTDASAMCGTFPEWGKLYTPGQVFIHWQTNRERVTRGFQIMFYHVTSKYGITIFERSLPTVCGLIPLARNKRDEEEYDDDDDFELKDEKTIYVPQGVSKPAEAVPRSRTKRVASAGGANTTRGETPFLVVLEVINKKDKNAPPFKFFYGVLIAENFVVSSSQAKHYQEEDKPLRKIKLRFGVYTFDTRTTDDHTLFKSALKIYKHAQCENNIKGEPFAKDPDKTNWEYTESNLKACPMLMVTGKVPTTDMIQPAFFPWFTFSWKSSMQQLSTFSKRIFHVGFMSDAAGTAVLEGVENKIRRISMQRTFDTACLVPLEEETISPQRVCGFSTNGKGPCQADIGGPMLKRMIVDNEGDFGGIIRHWVVMGILVKAECGTTKPNDGDKTGRRYAAYLEVNAYLYWMQQVMLERGLRNCRRPMTDEALADIPTSP